MERIWKPINLKPFNKSHLISNYGDIRVIKTNRLLKQRFDKDIYYLKKIALIDFLTINCNIIDEKLVIR